MPNKAGNPGDPAFPHAECLARSLHSFRRSIPSQLDRPLITQDQGPQVDSLHAAHSGDATAAPGTPSRRVGLPPVAWASAVLVVGLLCTVLVAHREWRGLQESAEASRRALADAGTTRLRVPLEQAASTLRAMQTVFLSNDQMDQARFSQYHASLRSPLAPASYTSVAFARRSPVGQPLADEVSYRYEFVTPYEGNAALVGFDMVTQRANLNALLRARDTDTVVISAPFTLRQTVPAGQNPIGITLRLPVYSDGPTPDIAQPATRARDRRARHRHAPAAAGRNRTGGIGAGGLPRARLRRNRAGASVLRLRYAGRDRIADAGAATGFRWPAMAHRDGTPPAADGSRPAPDHPCRWRRHQPAAGRAGVVAGHHAAACHDAGRTDEPRASARARCASARSTNCCRRWCCWPTRAMAASSTPTRRRASAWAIRPAAAVGAVRRSAAAAPRPRRRCHRRDWGNWKRC